jgi:D-alanine--poly(phosphoribitol) ligase subunit 2
MEKTIARIVADVCGADADEIKGTVDLFGEGFLDSFGMLQMLVALSSEFGIELDPADIERSQISTIDGIVRTVSKYGGGAA